MTWTPLTSTTYPLIRDRYVSDVLITPPVIEPVDLDEVKKHLRFTSTSEDTLLDTYIAMARGFFEEATGRQLIAATWERRMEGFTGPIELPHPPLLEIVSVTYDDGDGAAQTVDEADYTIHAPSGPLAGRGILTTVSGVSWPTTAGLEGSVRVRYRAGYGEQPGDVPELIKGALYFLVGYFHQYRSEVFATTPGTSLEQLPIGAQQIIRSFKYSALPLRQPQRVTWG